MIRLQMPYYGLYGGATDELAFNGVGSTAKNLTLHINMRRKYVSRRTLVSPVAIGGLWVGPRHRFDLGKDVRNRVAIKRCARKRVDAYNPRTLNGSGDRDL